MAKFQYTFVGDSNKIFRGRLIKPGDLVEADEELINGHFDPVSEDAKTAKASREADEIAAIEAHEVSISAAASSDTNPSLAEEEVEPTAPAKRSRQSTKAPAPPVPDAVQE